MSSNASLEGLTAEQSQAMDKAALLIIKARREAAAVLERAGLRSADDPFGFGSPCHAHIVGFGECPCHDYRGDGGPCLNRITLDPPASAPHSSCGHRPMDHLGDELTRLLSRSGTYKKS